MPDHLPDHDDQLRDAFEGFRTDALAAVRPDGADAVRGRVRHRRRRQGVLAGVAALAILASGGAATGAVLHARHSRPTVNTAQNSPTPNGNHGTPTDKASEHGHPSGSPAPDGRLTLAQLGNATLSIPDWGVDYCPSGSMPFSGNHSPTVSISAAPGMTDLEIQPDLVYADLRGDGHSETVATILCRTNDIQVVAFGRDTAGHVVTLGRVAATTLDHGPNPESIDEVSANDDGSIATHWVEVKTQNPRSQTRSYRWTGSAFDQVAGPTSFPTGSGTTQLTLSAVGGGTVTLAAVGNGNYQGTLNVAIHNNSDQPVSKASLVIQMTGIPMIAAKNGWNCESPNTQPVNELLRCVPILPGGSDSSMIPANGSGTESFAVTIQSTPASTAPAKGSASGTVQIFGLAPDNSHLPQTDGQNMLPFNVNWG